MYTIKILRGGEAKKVRVFQELTDRLSRSKFNATLRTSSDAKGFPLICVKPVRLRNAKSYCGAHPGPCLLNGKKKPNMTLLEWDDWISFHKIINATLNKLRTNADVWSNPLDIKGKMWIRKGKLPRVKWDWTEVFNSYGHPIRVWNGGTPDQFIKECKPNAVA